MKNFLFTAAFFTCSLSLYAQSPLVPKYDYMNVSVIESLIPGGAGRSRMLITDENGKSVEFPMSNFFSFGGINFGNIGENDQKTILKLKELNDKGWEVVTSAAGATESIFITRYLFRKPKN
jgi:hypothetical protein